MAQTATEELEMIEISIEVAKAQIDMAAALRRLYKNKDFKKVFTDHFLGSDCARIVKALADPACQDQASQMSLQKRITAVGQVVQFMLAVERFGDMAATALTDSEEAREEILREGV